jgi:hypothetical protein
VESSTVLLHGNRAALFVCLLLLLLLLLRFETLRSNHMIFVWGRMEGKRRDTAALESQACALTEPRAKPTISLFVCVRVRGCDCGGATRDVEISVIV